MKAGQCLTAGKDRRVAPTIPGHSLACALARWAIPALILQGQGAGQRVQRLESWRLQKPSGWRDKLALVSGSR